MIKIVNIVYGAAALLVAAMFLEIVSISQDNKAMTARVSQAERAVATGKSDYTTLRALAFRVNEAAATDKELKAVMDKLDISVTLASSSAPAAAASAKTTH